MQSPLSQFGPELENLVESIPDANELAALRPQKRKKLRLEIERAIAILRGVLQRLDPVKQPPVIFDPTDPEVIGELIAHTLIVQPVHPMASVDQFYGSGVYAIYYNGDFEAYAPLKNTENPIYVGKADPGELHAKTVEEQGTALSGRLRHHRGTIESAINLKVEHFTCRFLVVRNIRA